MDSITQIVLGAAVANAAIGKKVGNRALLWGAIGGTIPDLDVFFKYTHSYVDSMALHRGFSHSIFFACLLAPLLGWLIAKIYKQNRGSAKAWTWAMLLALATHPMLDAFTTWGTSLWWPFTETRVAINSIFVLDPLYTVPFMICLVVSMFYRKKTSLRAKWNWAGIIISSAYLLSTVVNQQLVYKKFETAWQKAGIHMLKADVKPTPMNNILWTANIESDSSFYLGYYSWMDTYNDISFTEVNKNHELLDPFRDHPDVQQLLKITIGFYVIEKFSGGLYMHDLRFGQMEGWNPEKGEFVFTYRLHIKNSEIQSIDQRPNNFEGMGDAFNMLVKRIKGHGY